MLDKKSPKASIIIPAKNEGINVENTVNSLMAETDEEIEIVVVNDNSEDDCCGFLEQPRYKRVKLLNTSGLGAAGARNYGANFAKAEILIFSDAHVFVKKGWLTKILADFEGAEVAALAPAIAPHDNPKNVGYGQTWKEDLKITWLIEKPKVLKQVPLAPGGFLAVRKAVFQDVGGFDQGFRVWGKEDEEISLKLWLFGYKVYVEPEVKVLHVFRKRHPYPVALEHVHYNLFRMALSHFNQIRIAKVLSQIKEYAYAEKLISEVILGDIWEQRKRYFSKRKFDDDWFIKRFKINF